MTNASTGTSEPMTYALPAEPEGPVWDSHGRRWTPAAVDGLWIRYETGVLCTWARLLEGYGPLTTTPPWEPEVGGIVETVEQYEAMPEGSVVSRDLCGPVFRKFDDGRWAESAASTSYDSRVMASESRTILRVGWSL